MTKIASYSVVVATVTKLSGFASWVRGMRSFACAGVGVFPKSEEILICGLSPGRIALQSVRPAKAEMRQRASGEDSDEANIPILKQAKAEYAKLH